MTNYYTVPFNNPKTYMSFAGIKGSSERFASSKFNQWTFNVPEETIQHWISVVASLLTWKHIGGVQGAITNLGGAIKHLQMGGVEDFQIAVKKYKNSANNGYADLISRSGVIDFNDFFSESMVASLVEDEIENKTAQLILGEMLAHYARTRKNMVIKKNLAHEDRMKNKAFEDSYNEMLANIEVHLDNSRALERHDRQIVILSEKRAKSRKTALKKRRNKQRASNLANASINAQYQVSKYINQDAKGIRAKIWNQRVKAQQAYAGWIDFKNLFGKLNMGYTEQLIRSIAFIMGVEHGKEQRHLPGKPLEDYTEKEEKKAIAYGDRFSKLYNFGLSTTDVGMANWGAFGNLFGKFKYWSQQNMGAEINVVQEAFRAVRDSEDILAGKSKRMREFFRVLKLSFTTGGKTLHISNQEVATFRRFILMGGIATAISDFLIFGPIPALRLLKYSTGASLGVRNFGSDLLSMTFFVMVTLPYLLMSGADEEEYEKQFTFFSRKTMLGWAPNTFFDFTGLLFSAIIGNGKIAWRKVKSLVRNLPGGSSAQQVSDAIRNLIDIFGD